MYQPLVSILIPCYNAEKCLSESISSAVDQTWKNIEIIIVDDGSTDSSLAIAKTFESKNIKVISQENRGASAARNQALIYAQGDFIQYLDADDLLAIDKIELQVNLVQNSYKDYLIAGEWGVFYTSRIETKFIKQELWQDMSSIDWLICCWQTGGMMPLHSWLVPRNIANQAGNWNENLSLNDDGEYFCRVILASKGVKFCVGARSYYRSGLPNSLSKQRSKPAFLSYYESVKLITERLLMDEDSYRTRYASACYWQRFVFTSYPQAPALISSAEEKIRTLGGCDLKSNGGIMFKIIRDILGWKIAVILQRFYYRFRYQKHTSFLPNR
jgi:glycosyltransferase involved in cell wall biosynthesis